MTALELSLVLPELILALAAMAGLVAGDQILQHVLGTLHAPIGKQRSLLAAVRFKPIVQVRDGEPSHLGLDQGQAVIQADSVSDLRRWLAQPLWHALRVRTGILLGFR